MRGRHALTAMLCAAAALGAPGAAHAADSICVTVVVTGPAIGTHTTGPTCLPDGSPVPPSTDHHLGIPVTDLVRVDVYYFGPP